uniref:helix-turn-helix transcriptional regulator n=1 Tax=Enterococcus casseliflavus TaxID=37734 RepID=UPI0011A55173
MEIGKMLRQKRTDLNLTQEDIAKQFNVTRQTVSRWENELSYPNIDTLVELSIFFEFSLDEILRGDSGMATVFLTNFIRCRTSFRMLFRLSL